MTVLVHHEEIDMEWVELIQEAKKMGLTIEEIREFIKNST